MKVCYWVYPLIFLVSFFSTPELTSIEPASNVGLNNRILAKVNGKAISAFDVMKRMDVLFYQMYPQFSSSPQHRFQFYQKNWEDILKEMIDRALIVADAKEKELPVSDGDVREEMEEVFGPNVIDTIDQLRLSFEEVWEMTHTNITVRRMLMYKVNSKAIASVKPADIQEAYQTFLKEQTFPSTWSYQVLSIRGNDPKQISHTAELVQNALNENELSFNEIPHHLSAQIEKEESHTEIILSQKFQHTDQSISPSHLEILSHMTPGQTSAPIQQTSRATNLPVYRFYYLIQHEKSRVPELHEVEEKIKNKLLDTAIAKETELYLQSLRQYYGLDKNFEQQTASIETFPYYLN